MIKDKSKQEIDFANSVADYHINEIVEGLIPEVESLSEPQKEDIRRRLCDAFYSGADWVRENPKELK